MGGVARDNLDGDRYGIDMGRTEPMQGARVLGVQSSMSMISIGQRRSEMSTSLERMVGG
jgi:hypothetical protein